MRHVTAVYFKVFFLSLLCYPITMALNLMFLTVNVMDIIIHMLYNISC